ncbi:unnamed protein product, partial [Didymodactylos carnosus]
MQSFLVTVYYQALIKNIYLIETVLFLFNRKSSSIIYECGTNDVSDHSVESVIDDVKDVIKTTRELNPKIKISITSIPFRSRKLNVGGFNKIKDYNRQLKQLCMDQNVNFLQLNFEQGDFNINTEKAPTGFREILQTFSLTRAFKPSKTTKQLIQYKKKEFYKMKRQQSLVKTIQYKKLRNK